MRAGEIIRGYRITTEPTNSGGGMCMWAFAEKDRRQYFLKEFLQPKWPTPESMGSPAGKELRRAACYEFERRHQEIMRRLADTARTRGGGNLVTAVEFFRAGTTYYKVTEKITTASLSSLDPLSVHERAVILRTLVLSLQMLHAKDIVHGDLKPSNVLIQRAARGLHTAKLIDFDDSYLSGSPPTRDQVIGDSIYGAPEWFGYTKKESTVPPSTLTRAADIFTLALLFHYYLTGSLPGRASARYPAPGQAVSAGERLLIDRRLTPGLVKLLARMTALRPGDRPTVEEVFTELADEAMMAVRAAASSRGVIINMPGSGSAEPAPDPGDRGSSGKGPSGLRIRMGKKAEGAPAEGAADDRDRRLFRWLQVRRRYRLLHRRNRQHEPGDRSGETQRTIVSRPPELLDG